MASSVWGDIWGAHEALAARVRALEGQDLKSQTIDELKQRNERLEWLYREQKDRVHGLAIECNCLARQRDRLQGLLNAADLVA